MDVLAYSAFNRRAELDAQVTAKEAQLETLRQCVQTVQAQANARTSAANWLQTGEYAMLCCPHKFGDYETLIENNELTGTSNGFKVCDSNNQFNCGANCTWTVPAGVTCARFQLWGAGGGSGPGCCCGGSPFGSSGAYATVSMPVVAGCSYTICSGCAYCCFPSTGTCGRLPGCPSYVQGHGLTNFCADGGQGRLGTMMAMYGQRCRCRLQHIVCNDSGPCFCNRGADYCFQSSCATCGQVGCFIPGAQYFGSAHCGSVVRGVRGMWPEICFDTNHYGYELRPPMYGLYCCLWCFPYDSGYCCGCCCSAQRGCHRYPGMGGWATHVMSGANGMCGDMGRMGMVCVSYCC